MIHVQCGLIYHAVGPPQHIALHIACHACECGFVACKTQLIYCIPGNPINIITRGEIKLFRSHNLLLQSPIYAVGPPQHVLWNVKWPYLFIMITAVSAEVVLKSWAYFFDEDAILASSLLINCVLTSWHCGYWTFHLCKHVLLRCLFFLQKDAFRLVSFAMSLLLAFRLNRTYERYG